MGTIYLELIFSDGSVQAGSHDLRNRVRCMHCRELPDDECR